MENFNLEVFEENGTEFVGSKEVAKLLNKEHKDFKRDIKNQINFLDYDENDMYADLRTSQKYFIDGFFIDKYGRKQHQYLLTKIGCDFMANKMTGRKGAKFTDAYITAFENMKEHIKRQLIEQPKDSYMIDDPVERAKRWIEEQEERQALENKTQEQKKQIDEYKPKALFADTLESSDNSILVGELAKLITQGGYPIGQNKLFKWLRDNDYLCKSGERYNLPTQRSVDMNLFDIRKRVITNADGSTRVTRTTKVTGKGQTYFVNKFLQ